MRLHVVKQFDIRLLDTRLQLLRLDEKSDLTCIELNGHSETAYVVPFIKVRGMGERDALETVWYPQKFGKHRKMRPDFR